MHGIPKGLVFPCRSNDLVGSSVAIRAMERSRARRRSGLGRGFGTVAMRKISARVRVRKSVLFPRTCALLDVDQR